MILDNLRKAGILNTRKEDRLKFDSLEPFAGTWIHAVGTYPERAVRSSVFTRSGPPEGGTPNEKIRRAAVCIGPEHGTVGPDLVKEAVKEAVQGVGFDILIVCGFAFALAIQPPVDEVTSRPVCRPAPRPCSLPEGCRVWGNQGG